MAKIELQNVTFAYESGQNVLTGLTLTIADGERHAILGASGAGKTTLLNLLSGLLRPTDGRILFDGEDVTEQPAAARTLTQVFQFPVLYEALTVQENLEFALNNHKELNEDASARIEEITTELGLVDCLKRKPKSLSLYEKQLVAVAKAIVRIRTRLVLLDEPLTAVDPKRKWQMRQVLRRIQEKYGLTMIYVTHDQTEAMAFAERVSLLTTTGLVQTGSPEDLYNRPATPFVGHFVGSPGMNFVPGALVGREGSLIGFRAGWASVVAAETAVKDLSINGRVAAFRVMPGGGVAYVETEHGELCVDASECEIGATVGIDLNRYATFIDDRLEEIVEVGS